MIVDLNILITLPDMPSYVHHFSQITEEDPENQNNYKDFKSLKLTLSYILRTWNLYLFGDSCIDP